MLEKFLIALSDSILKYLFKFLKLIGDATISKIARWLKERREKAAKKHVEKINKLLKEKPMKGNEENEDFFNDLTRK